METALPFKLPRQSSHVKRNIRLNSSFPQVAAPVFLLAAAILVSCGQQDKSTDPAAESAPDSPYHDIPGARYVGAQSCRACHEQAFEEWKQSDHHLAMNPATEEFVLGDFDDTEFEHYGQRFRFFRRDDEYWVNAPDDSGEVRDMKIAYTFGHEPLQQYLIAFPGGRYQALQACWDSRPEEEGGQRWFHLYPDEPVPPEDVLHWTRRHFNWNYMCADCHSTNLRKNFDSETKEYHTTWSEMNVSCEACHGPASEHLRWANHHLAEEGTETPDGNDSSSADTKGGNLDGDRSGKTEEDRRAVTDYLKNKGLVVTLKEPEPGAWIVNPETGQPERTRPLASDVQVETCARCHSHRQLLAPAFEAGQPFHDTHLPSVLSDELYHHDGQIDEEVYVYGSFVQSKMFHAGVRCTDCHHPHTMKPLARGNALCVRCHTPEKYDSPDHHFHPPGSTGASCVECHMPETHFMVVDGRRDHSLRIPRPDLAGKTASPDACTSCHDDKDPAWAAEAAAKWWGSGPRNAHYGEILAAARNGEPGSLDRLAALATDQERPAIVRATAVEGLGRQGPLPETLPAIRAGLRDEAPEVRIQALDALADRTPAQRRDLAANLLADPSRAVRTEAARVLAAARNLLDEEQRAAFDSAAAEFTTRQEAIADRAAGPMGLALFHTDLGETDKAEEAYRQAVAVEPEFVPARVNLAELLLQQNRPAEAEKEFRGAVDAAAGARMDHEEGVARDALARFLIRQKRYDEGIEELGRAVELMPGDARVRYFYGVALNSTGHFDEALSHLEEAHRLEPRQLEYLTGLATICRDAGKTDLALRYARRALDLQPDNPQLQQLVQSLGR